VTNGLQKKLLDFGGQPDLDRYVRVRDSVGLELRLGDGTPKLRMEGRGTRSSSDNNSFVTSADLVEVCALLSVVIVTLCSGNICVCVCPIINHNIAKIN